MWGAMVAASTDRNACAMTTEGPTFLSVFPEHHNQIRTKQRERPPAWNGFHAEFRTTVICE